MVNQRQFKFKASKYLALILIAVHGTTLAALYPLNFPDWAKIALSALVLSSLLYHLSRDALLLAPSSGVALMFEGDQIVLTTRNGEHIAGKILADSLVTPLLTVLNILPLNTRLSRSVIILHDSLDAESFRQLRVRLKWGM